MKPVYVPQKLEPIYVDLLGKYIGLWRDIGLYSDPVTAYSIMYQTKIKDNCEVQMKMEWVPGIE